jgi:hypothetical protein
VKLSQQQLRGLITEELDTLAERSVGGGLGFNQAKNDQALVTLRSHIQGAKAALSELFQNATDQKASDQAQIMLNGLNKITRELDSFSALTKDPWAGRR